MFDFEKIGEKIKGLARTLFVIEAIVSMIMGISLMVTHETLIFPGILVIVLGPVFAWISSWLLYGFGEIIDKLTKIEENTRACLPPKETAAPADASAENIVTADEAKPVCIVPEEEVNPVYVVPEDAGYTIVEGKEISCNKCGCRQKIGRSSCWNCDAPFAIPTKPKE